MSDPVHRSSERPSGADSMSVAEKLMAEWEARHDVAARGGRIDPAAALQHYISHSRCSEELHHRDHPHPRRTARERSAAEQFAAEHPLLSSWVRWGEDRR